MVSSAKAKAMKKKRPANTGLRADWHELEGTRGLRVS
jgi:hypothetical protein